MKGRLTIRKTSARTGRSGYHQINDEPTVHFKVQEFVKQLCSSSSRPCWLWVLVRNPIARKLSKQVRDAAEIGLVGTYYRARQFPIDSTIPPSSDLGPPPLDKQDEGRYTEGKDVVLYLSRNRKTAAIESDSNGSKPRIFVQRFDLNLSDIRVLRLSKNLEAQFPHLHYLLLDSEYLPGEASFAPMPYSATQFISYLCLRRGVQGVEYPSMRGDFKNDSEAVNLVLFKTAVDRAVGMMSGDPFEYTSLGK